MFEFEGNESILVRVETYYFFFFTVYALVKLDFAFASWFYMFVYLSMFAYESGDEEVDFESQTASSIELIIPRPYSSDIIDQEDLFGIFEKGNETVTFNKSDNSISFDNFSKVIDSTSKIIHDSKDRYKYLWDFKAIDATTTVEKEQKKNVLQYKLVTTNKFTPDELRFVKAYKTDVTMIPSWKALQMEKDLFFYQEFMDMVNNFLFQTYIAQGIFPSLEYDFRRFMCKSKLLNFDKCKLINSNKKSLSKKLINP